MTLRYSGFEYFKSDAKFKFCPSYTAQYGISIPQFYPDNRVFLKVTIRQKQKYVTPVTLLNGSLYRFACYAETVPNAKGFIERDWILLFAVSENWMRW